MEDLGNDHNDYDASKASKIRLKTKRNSSSRSKRHHDEDDRERHHTHKRRRHSTSSEAHRSHRESKRKSRHRSSGKTVQDHTFTRHGDYDNPDHRYRESLYDGLEGDGSGSPHERDSPDAGQAFRESLFDALADDEGAAYWEGVYGQPVHVYPNTKTGPDGELERMDDEEYAEYVRSKMWEKSHQHIIEEREARERARKQHKDRRRELDEEAARQEEERESIRRKMEESLRRGEERKKAKEAEASWVTYTQKWEDLKNRKDLSKEDTDIRELIPWPVVTGKRRHISKEEIEYFFESSSAWKDDAKAMLKVERVRWHPDKMQQRFGKHIDAETMKSVTAVFQVVDRLWSERQKPH